MSIATSARAPAKPTRSSTPLAPAEAGRPVDRTGGMENAPETLAADRTAEQARFPHRLGRQRAPPIRSTGKIVLVP